MSAVRRDEIGRLARCPKEGGAFQALFLSVANLPSPAIFFFLFKHFSLAVHWKHPVFLGLDAFSTAVCYFVRISRKRRLT
jgi:hypothetical protein